MDDIIFKLTGGIKYKYSGENRQLFLIYLSIKTKKSDKNI